MSWLATGAGASGGLQDVLTRLLRERQFEEEMRANQADEGFRNRQLQETSALRQATQEGNDFARSEANRIREQEAQNIGQNRFRDDMRLALGDLIPGARIETETRDAAVQSGAALPERFKPQIIPDDFMGPIQEGEPQRGEAGAYTLEGQAKTAPVRDAASQLKTVSYKGKPVEAAWDPDTNTFTYQGQDITKDVGHFREPPREDRMWLQTPDGQIPRANAREQFDKDGKPIGFAPTSTQRDRTASMGRIQPILHDIDSLSERINTKYGPLAKVEGGLRGLMARASSDDDVADYMSLIKSYSVTVARAMGHSANMSDADRESIMEMFPMPGDSKGLRDRKVARLMRTLGDGGEDGGAAITPAPAGGGGPNPPPAASGGTSGFRIKSVRPAGK